MMSRPLSPPPPASDRSPVGTAAAGGTVFVATIRLRQAGSVTARFTGAAHGALVASDGGSDLYTLHGADEATVAAFVASHDRPGEAPRVLARTSTSVVLRVRGGARPLASVIAAADCALLYPVVFADGVERYTFVADDRRALVALAQRFTRFGDVVLERESEVDAATLAVAVPVADLAGDLTPRQLDVLRRAIDGGYYESPRRTSSTDLARGLGVSRSTFEEHRRKGERGLLHRFGKLLARHPTLAHAASRRVGRPPTRGRASDD